MQMGSISENPISRVGASIIATVKDVNADVNSLSTRIISKKSAMPYEESSGKVEEKSNKMLQKFFSASLKAVGFTPVVLTARALLVGCGVLTKGSTQTVDKKAVNEFKQHDEVRETKEKVDLNIARSGSISEATRSQERNQEALESKIKEVQTKLEVAESRLEDLEQFGGQDDATDLKKIQVDRDITEMKQELVGLQKKLDKAP